MTPAQKAKRTKLERKYWAEYEEASKQANEDFYKFAKTLYPKRDAKIDAAEAKMEQIIADARAEFEETRSRIMDEFENNPEVFRLDKVRREISAAQSNIYKSKVEAIQI